MVVLYWSNFRHAKGLCTAVGFPSTLRHMGMPAHGVQVQEHVYAASRAAPKDKHLASPG